MNSGVHIPTGPRCRRRHQASRRTPGHCRPPPALLQGCCSEALGTADLLLCSRPLLADAPEFGIWKSMTSLLILLYLKTHQARPRQHCYNLSWFNSIPLSFLGCFWHRLSVYSWPPMYAPPTCSPNLYRHVGLQQTGKIKGKRLKVGWNWCQAVLVAFHCLC